MNEVKLQTKKRFIRHSVFLLFILFNTLFGSSWRLVSANTLERVAGDAFELSASSVISYNPGLKNNGEAIDDERADPANALSWPQNEDSINFVALGFGGELILEIESLPISAEQINIQFFETSFGDTSCDTYPETVSIYISNDNIEWEDLGIGCQDFSITLNGSPSFRYIKLVDISDPNKFSEGADGYDVDGIIINYASHPIATLALSATNTFVIPVTETFTLPVQAINTSTSESAQTPTLNTQTTNTPIIEPTQILTLPAQATNTSTLEPIQTPISSTQIITNTPTIEPTQTLTLPAQATNTSTPEPIQTPISSTQIITNTPTKEPTQTPTLPAQATNTSTPEPTQTLKFSTQSTITSIPEPTQISIPSVQAVNTLNLEIIQTPTVSLPQSTIVPSQVTPTISVSPSNRFWGMIISLPDIIWEILVISIAIPLSFLFITIVFLPGLVRFSLKNFEIVINIFNSNSIFRWLFVNIMYKILRNRLLRNRQIYRKSKIQLEEQEENGLSSLEISRTIEKRHKRESISQKEKRLLHWFDGLEKEITFLDNLIKDIDIRLKLIKNVVKFNVAADL